jgi:CubicO group peptidase (beta-lactamase class C family)
MIEKLLDSLYRSRVFNGCIVVAQGDSIIFNKSWGYANFKDSIQFSINTSSDGGSLAKTFTALTVRRLAASGLINLDDDVSKYLPQYPYPGTRIADLITHNTGGLPDYEYYFSKLDDTTVLTNQLILEILSKFNPPLHDPTRKSFNYDNAAMDVAALIIEKVTGKTFGQVLSEFYFAPLQMHSSFIRPALLSPINKSRAIGYKWDHDTLALHDIVDREGFYGGGNIHFTTLDLCKWGQAFYNDSFHRAVRMDLNRTVKTGNKVSGLNSLNLYYAKEKNAFYYWGNVYGFYSHLYFDTGRKFTIAFMTNTTLPYSLRQPLASVLVEIMETGGYDKRHFQNPSYLLLQAKDCLPGTYVSGNGDTLRIWRGKSIVHIQKNDDLRYNLFIVDAVTAYAPGLDVWIGLTRERNDTVLHFNSVFTQSDFKKVK